MPDRNPRRTLTPRPHAVYRPATAALVLTLAAAAPLGLTGCSTTTQRATPAVTASADAPDGSLVLQLDAADFTPASERPLPRSLQRRWAGQSLTPDAANETDAADHRIEVRLATPRKLSRDLRKRLADQSPRQGVLAFTADQATTKPAGRSPITVLDRPGVTITLVTPPSAPTDGAIRSGLARVTFDGAFLEAVAELDADARPADALWLAMHGLSTSDVRRLHAARVRPDLPQALDLADAGVDPAGLRQMERRGTIFRVEEWLALSAAGVTTADALAFVDADTQPTVDAITDAQAQVQKERLAAALEAEAAEQARLDAEAAKLAIAEAEAEAERLEQEALALEAQQAAETPAVETTDADEMNAEAVVETEADADAAAVATAAAVASSVDEPSETEEATPDFYDTVLSDLRNQADTPLPDAPGDEDVVGSTTAVAAVDPEEVPAANAAADDPDAADDLVAAAMADADPVPADDSRPTDPAGAISEDLPRVAAGDMIPTEPAERAVPSRYVELLGRLGITRPAHVAALYESRVPPKMIHRFQQAGVRPSVIELIDAHRLELDPDAAQTLTDAGYEISIYDLALLDQAGVDPSYAAALFDERFRPLTATQIAELWENRVSIADIRDAREKAIATPMSNLDSK